MLHRFADRDIFMRFRGGGIGHAIQLHPEEAFRVSPKLFTSARIYPSYLDTTHEIDEEEDDGEVAAENEETGWAPPGEDCSEEEIDMDDVVSISGSV